MSTDVLIEDGRWNEAGLDALAPRAVAATLRHLRLDPEMWEVTVLGCDDARIATLNADFRGKPRPTNVLSWPSEERGAFEAGYDPDSPTGDPELGDIALAFETCQREAAEQRKQASQHILHLIVHGVLHLLGYDHERDGDGDLMESHEIAILAELGVPDPYI
ncbi:MAG: rRNA maturation RNase YbeY [Pseudomonadota bacterium]